MSIKKEVNQLTEVYRKLITEEMEGGINIGAPTGLPALETQTDVENTPFDDSSMDFTSSNNIDGENTLFHSPAPVSDDNKSMAKSEVYKLVKTSTELFQMLMSGSDCTKIEPWQLSKITKAADYICSVKNSLEFDEFEKMAGEMSQGLSELDMPVVSKVKDILASEPLSVNEEVLKQVIFNIECLKEAKSVKGKKDATCSAAKKGCKCSKCPKCTANKKKK